MSYTLTTVVDGARAGRPLTYNGSFMGTLVVVLETADLIDSAAKPGRAATWPPKGLKVDAERADALLEHAQIGGKLRPAPTAVEQKAIDAYRAADLVFRVGKPGKGGRLPKYKLSSNDAWRVTAKEAGALVAGLTAALDGDDFELACDLLDLDRREGDALAKEVRRFRDFCRRAAAAEGFEVS